MSKEPNLAMLPIPFGIILTIIALSVVAWPINSAFGKEPNNDQNLHFEIFDCTVQGNSTHEISGPCPDVGAETKVDKSPETKVDKSPETKSPETKSPETKSPETKSPETEVDKSPETNNIAESEIKEDDFKKYDFSEIHLAEPEMEVNETKIITSTLPDSSASIDPFGPLS
jgi:hypothetical protein